MLDRESAIARLIRIADRENTWFEEIGLPDASSIGAFLREIAEMLREQEPEIVRCKDCKHGEIDTAINGVLLSITCGGVRHRPEWFCADGERVKLK